MMARDKQSKRFHQQGFYVGLFFVFGIALVSTTLFSANRDLIAPLAPTIQESSAPLSSVSQIATMPILFEPNVGQAAEGVDFIARDGSNTVLVSAEGLFFPSFRQRLVGADPDAGFSGEGQAASVSNYYLGADPTKWRTGVANYHKVVYRGVYSDIDLEYAGLGPRLNYHFIVHPGGNPDAIAFSLEGVESLVVADGRVSAKTASGALSWEALRAYQVVDGRETRVPARFIAMGDAGYRFEVGSYDPNLALVIDPTLSLELSTYWGGTGVDVFSNAVIHNNGRIHVSGRTVSANYPTTAGAYQSTFGGGTFDLALFAYASASGTLVYSSYFGGSGEELQFANSTAIDQNGDVYLVGRTSSANFPTLDPYDASYNGGLFDGFLSKFSPTGALLYSTYLGGLDDDQCVGVAVNSTEETFVSCSTKSTDFPTVNALDSTFGGGTLRDITMTKFSADGSALLFSTYYGGTGDDGPTGIELDPSENPTMYGFTSTTGIAHVNPFQGTYGGSTLDGLLVTYAEDGSSILYSTYIGGNGLDSVRTFEYDHTGRMVFDMSNGSTNMPTVNPFQATSAGGFENFLGKFNLAGSALEYGSYFGGSGLESPFGMVIDSEDNSYYIGSTSSTNFPLTLPLQPTYGGATDIMAFSLPSDGSAPRFATYLGGSANDSSQAIAMEDDGVMWVAGQSASADFPQVDPLQAGSGGTTDAVFVKLTFVDPPTGGSGEFQAPQIRIAKTAEPSSRPDGPGEVTFTYTVTNPGFPPLYDVSVTDDRCSPLVFVGGDYNGDGQLQSYDEWTFACTATLTETTTNTATAVGYANGIRAEASANATVEVGSSLIEVMVEGLRAFINLQTGCRFFADEARLSNQISGTPERPDLLCPGDYITTPSFRTVYYVTREFIRRPFFNALVFLTHQSSFQGVKNVTDATLLTLKLGDLMAPKAGTVLVKFQGDTPSVYALFENPADPFKPIARVLETEAVAEANFGADWADFVIDLPPTMFDLFVQGAPILSQEEIDASLLLPRRDLEAVTNPYTFAILRKMTELIGPRRAP